MLPSLHDVISLGFGLLMNVVAFAAIGWMVLWLCWVALALLKRLRTTVRNYQSDRTCW